MKYLILASFILLGCGKVDTYDLPFIDDNYTSVMFKGQVDMCDRQPDSMFCSDQPTIGDIQPTGDYLIGIVDRLLDNTTYKVSDDWHYAGSVDIHMVRDCEDEAMEMINTMVEEGIDKKYLFLVYQLTSETSAHMFIGVKTIDKGLRHMDLNTVHAPIEKQINWHMRMDDAGVRKWIKGNIQ